MNNQTKFFMEGTETISSLATELIPEIFKGILREFLKRNGSSLPEPKGVDHVGYVDEYLKNFKLNDANYYPLNKSVTFHSIIFINGCLEIDQGFNPAIDGLMRCNRTVFSFKFEKWTLKFGGLEQWTQFFHALILGNESLALEIIGYICASDVYGLTGGKFEKNELWTKNELRIIVAGALLVYSSCKAMTDVLFMTNDAMLISLERMEDRASSSNQFGIGLNHSNKILEAFKENKLKELTETELELELKCWAPQFIYTLITPDEIKWSMQKSNLHGVALYVARHYLRQIHFNNCQR
jgi:hypothetical protein